MKWGSADYRSVALERIGEAWQLKTLERYGLAMYVSGIAAECMLRSFHREGAPFDEKHDIASLFRSCDMERLGEGAMRRLRGPIQAIHLLWLNNFRFADERMLLGHFKKFQLDRGLPRGANPLKVRGVELFDACAEVVTVGEQRWKSP
jgi:hypothetical protein